MKKIYLAGSMEHAKDGGVNWRKEIASLLRERGFIILNPIEMDEAAVGEKYEDFVKRLNMLKQMSIKEYKRHFDEIVARDTVEIYNADIVIARYEEYELGQRGTISEIFYSSQILNNPTYLFTSNKLIDISGWILGCIPLERIHKSLEEVVEHVTKEFGTSKKT